MAWQQEVPQDFESASGRRRRIPRVTKARDDVIDLAPPPAHSYTGLPGRWCGQRPPERRIYEDPGKVDPGVYCELQRTPEPAIDLHEVRGSCPGVALELHHRRSLPLESGEQRLGVHHQVAVGSDAHRADTHPARRRLLADAFVSEPSDGPAIPPKEKHARARAFNTLLQQQGVRRRWERARDRAQLPHIVCPADPELDLTAWAAAH